MSTIRKFFVTRNAAPDAGLQPLPYDVGISTQELRN
jgi:hypothetical protein